MAHLRDQEMGFEQLIDAATCKLSQQDDTYVSSLHRSHTLY